MFVLYYMCRLSSIFLRGDSRICSLARVITPWSCQLGRSWSVRGSAPVAILFIISMLTLQCRLLFNRVGSCFLGVGLVDRVCVCVWRPGEDRGLWRRRIGLCFWIHAV